MSALPPESGHGITTVVMSALCEKRTAADLFDYRIGADGRHFGVYGQVAAGS
jgi:hypothetical protein